MLAATSRRSSSSINMHLEILQTFIYFSYGPIDLLTEAMMSVAGERGPGTNTSHHRTVWSQTRWMR